MRSIATDVVGSKLDAHEKQAKLHVLVLVRIENIGVVLLDKKIGDGGDNTFSVGAVNKENGSLGHSSAID
jgi:hypothetical protein